ncbi:hypothetical protein B0T19DRAFT_24617 [Cercophora scortea]|uniref:Uncharacterized protein n=1 Tax=Cercophora scortea TaxID=314031 RepID=A0AAE0J3I3_9PEZI|nr:hypothetical protein B0T19DRAFT_24617 [Cercophora scortea]
MRLPVVLLLPSVRQAVGSFHGACLSACLGWFLPRQVDLLYAQGQARCAGLPGSLFSSLMTVLAAMSPLIHQCSGHFVGQVVRRRAGSCNGHLLGRELRTGQPSLVLLAPFRLFLPLVFAKALLFVANGLKTLLFFWIFFVHSSLPLACRDGPPHWYQICFRRRRRRRRRPRCSSSSSSSLPLVFVSCLFHTQISFDLPPAYPCLDPGPSLI